MLDVSKIPDLSTIPDFELITDRLAAIQDLYLCEFAFARKVGVTEYQDRADHNLVQIKVIEYELIARLGLQEATLYLGDGDITALRLSEEEVRLAVVEQMRRLVEKSVLEGTNARPTR